MAAATGGAIYKRPDGIVIIDPVKSKGQQQIVNACPYGVITWNPDLQIPQKCTWCVQRLETGESPRCMNACPGLVIKIGTWENTVNLDEAGRIEFTPLHPEYNTQSRAYYEGLPKTFIAGALTDSSTGECLAGATVTCTDNNPAPTVDPVVGSTTSDAYGDFWFDGLTAGNTYTITISKAGKTTQTIPVKLTTDTDLGEIKL
jgi:NAD-dependent dihydropyrimidine dehydrogenase PreA subunit